MEYAGIDFKSPEFIFRNLTTLNIADEDIAEEENLRDRISTIGAILAQVCFYTLCTLRAYQGVIKAPGVVGTHIVNTLIQYGCGSMLRIYVRNNLQLGKWREKGIKASDAVSKLLKAGTFEIVISTANAASFSQFTRDLFGKISPKTCIISAVFGIQRTRIYQLLKTPCVFRVFVERSDVLSVRLRQLDEPVPPSSPQRDVGSAHHGLSKKSLREGAILMATRIDDFKKQIVMLENYYTMWGMTNELAREVATDFTLGPGVDTKTQSDSVSAPGHSVHAPESKVAHMEADDHASFSAVSDVRSHDDESTVDATLKIDNAPEKSGKKKKVSALDEAIVLLAKHVGKVFQQEFSKIARIGDLVEFAEFKWDVFNNKPTAAPRLLGDQLAAQTSFENRNIGIMYVSTFLTDIEIKALFRFDNDVPSNYYYDCDIIHELDAIEDMGMGHVVSK